MVYGHFSDDGKEYVITRPDTPRPWVNYLTNGRYCAFLSQTGGGYSFLEDPVANGITRWGLVLDDMPGRYVYLRDEDTGDYWTINWQPARKDFESWECRVGLGYNQITSVRDGIQGRILYFVPIDEDLEYWIINIRNLSAKRRKLSVFPFVELSLGDARSNLLEAPFFALFNRGWEDKGILYARKTFWPKGMDTCNEEWPYTVFFASSLKVEGFDCTREAFLGKYRLERNPIVVERGECSNSENYGRNGVFAFQHFLNLNPGEEKEFVIVLGILKERPALEYVDLKFTKEKFSGVKKYWNDIVNKVEVATPDRDLNLAINIWNKYQNRIVFWWYRSSASYYLFGYQGVGFRDAVQAVIGTIPMDSKLSKSRIKFLSNFVYKNGNTCHNFVPLLMKGSTGDHRDVPLWLPLVVSYYLKETGDFSFLQEETGFLDDGKETIFEHVQKIIDFIWSERGARGLVLMQKGDWNDAMDFVGAKGKGESVMASETFHLVLDEWGTIAKLLNKNELAADYRRRAEELRKALNNNCWDGEWYVRGFSDDGDVIGSKKCKEAKIFLNSQSWAVIGGIAPQERAVKAMNSMEKYLDTPYGTAVFLPAYPEFDPKIGIITRFIPGEKENGAIFMHATAWSIIAEAMLGRKKAYDIYKKALFMNNNHQKYKSEPYVYPEYVAGPDSPVFGEGSHSWFTGSAPWMWCACLDYILGVKPTFDGLRIDPCIPANWDGFRVRREYREATYEITVINPSHVSKGVKEITVDGKKQQTILIPIFSDKKVHKVEVKMG